MKKIGIWLDKKTAYIVTIIGEEATMETLDSELEFFNVRGGSRSKTRWGPQQVVQDSRYLEREKHQLKKYFTEIVEKIRDAHAVVIFGPGQTGQQLEKEIAEHHHEFAPRIVKVEKANSMSDNQIVAWVREFFS
ncbi:hypothetical protein [Muriicola sp. Z0-33]|uniref:hypothetical protein n=1 Tax=Muriicola sp. Z0-33 TaxID=2816957 RepID=UPI00223704C0|nr:hypothetical protein [Muriicola sp. Z0-33]MCW5515764.1 hypothetical protein [Muriicola sp. Z0-33]